MENDCIPAEKERIPPEKDCTAAEKDCIAAEKNCIPAENGSNTAVKDCNPPVREYNRLDNGFITPDRDRNLDVSVAHRAVREGERPEKQGSGRVLATKHPVHGFNPADLL